MNFKKLLIAPAIILIMSSCTNEKPDNICRCADYEVMKGKDQFIADKDYSEKCTKYRESLNSSELEEWDNKLVLCPNMKTWMKEGSSKSTHWKNVYNTKFNINKSQVSNIGRWVYEYDNGIDSWSITLKIKKNNEYRMDIIYAIDRKLIIDKGEWTGGSSYFKLYSLNGRGHNMRCEIRNGKLILSQFKKRNGETMEVTLDLN